MRTEKRKRGRPRSKISKREYVQALIWEEYYGLEAGWWDEHEEDGLSFAIPFAYWKDRLGRLKTPLNKAEFDRMAARLYWAGIETGFGVVREQVLPLLIEQIPDLANASEQIRREKAVDTELRRHGSALPMLHPSDLKRKVVRPQYSQKEIAALTRRIKEMDVLPTVEAVAKLLKKSPSEVRALVVEAKRQGKKIAIEKPKKGPEIVVI